MIISSFSEILVCIGTNMFGYQLFDRVIYNGQEGFVFGRRSSGSFDI